MLFAILIMTLVWTGLVTVIINNVAGNNSGANSDVSIINDPEDNFDEADMY